MTTDQTPYHVEIRDTCEIIGLDRERVIEAVVATLRHCNISAAAVSVAVVDDAEISRLNEEFRDEAGATDVLAFDLRDDLASSSIEGEIVVSAETARRVAMTDGREPIGELMLYVVHGCLHLTGHDDLEPADRRRMHETENEILSALGYGAVFGEVRP